MEPENPAETKHIPARTMREVPDMWWDMILDGSLWCVDVMKFPFAVTPFTLRDAVRARARGRGKRTSIRIGGRFGDLVYVQAYGPHDKGFEVRLPINQAKTAPPIMPASRKPHWPEEFGPTDWSDVIKRLVADQGDEPSVTPWLLRHHPDFYWVEEMCGCGTDNWRVHPPACKFYPMLPAVEQGLKRVAMSPETWAARRDYH